MVLDNHRAHYSVKLKDFLEEQGVELLFLPPASSQYNPIETIWAVVKRRWRDILLLCDHDQVGEGWMRDKLIQICTDIEIETIQNIYTVHFKEIVGYLRSLKSNEEVGGNRVLNQGPSGESAPIDR